MSPSNIPCIAALRLPLLFCPHCPYILDGRSRDTERGGRLLRPLLVCIQLEPRLLLWFELVPVEREYLPRFRLVQLAYAVPVVKHVAKLPFRQRLKLVHHTEGNLGGKGGEAGTVLVACPRGGIDILRSSLRGLEHAVQVPLRHIKQEQRRLLRVQLLDQTQVLLGEAQQLDLHALTVRLAAANEHHAVLEVAQSVKGVRLCWRYALLVLVQLPSGGGRHRCDAVLALLVVIDAVDAMAPIPRTRLLR